MPDYFCDELIIRNLKEIESLRKHEMKSTSEAYLPLRYFLLLTDRRGQCLRFRIELHLKHDSVVVLDNCEKTHPKI